MTPRKQPPPEPPTESTTSIRSIPSPPIPEPSIDSITLRIQALDDELTHRRLVIAAIRCETSFENYLLQTLRFEGRLEELRDLQATLKPSSTPQEATNAI
jgi:hypothetical protein